MILVWWCVCYGFGLFFYPWQSGKFGSAVEEILLHACQVASTVIGARKSKMNYVHSPNPLGSLISMHYYTGPQTLRLQDAQRMQAGENTGRWRPPGEMWAELSDERPSENIPFYHCTSSITFLKLPTTLNTQQRPTSLASLTPNKQVCLFPNGSMNLWACTAFMF